MSSLWRKRQINDKKVKDEIEAIKQTARDIHAKLLNRQRTNDILARLFDIFLLCAGFTLCVYSFGVIPGLGLSVLALFARGEL